MRQKNLTYSPVKPVDFFDNISLTDWMTAAINYDLQALSCLVVEDNAFTSIDICNKLGALGINQIMTASNGQEGLEIIDVMETPPAVILLDLRMPVMGGTETLSRLSDRKYTGYVVIVSGVDDDTLGAVEKYARDCNVRLVGCLSKPPDEQLLSNLLSKCVD
jgi:CheY-like chemotaxis protein